VGVRDVNGAAKPPAGKRVYGDSMEEIVGTLGLWLCSFTAVATTVWGVAVLITGRAPQRELRHYKSVSQYGRFFIGLGFGSHFSRLAVSEAVSDL
jgi:hypothetical protein